MPFQLNTMTVIRWLTTWACLLMLQCAAAQTQPIYLYYQEIQLLEQQNKVLMARTATLTEQSQRDSAQLERYQTKPVPEAKITAAQINASRLDVAFAHSESTRTTQALLDARRHLAQSKKTLDQAEEALLKQRLILQTTPDIVSDIRRLEQVEQVLLTIVELQQRHIELLLKLQQQVRQAETNKRALLKVQMEVQYQQQIAEQALNNQRVIAKAQTEQNEWLSQLQNLHERQRLSLTQANGVSAQSIQLATDIFYLEERVRLSQVGIQLLSLSNKVQLLLDKKARQLGVTDINASQLLAEVIQLDGVLLEKNGIIEQQLSIEQASFSQNILTEAQLKHNEDLLRELQLAYSVYAETVADLETALSDYISKQQAKLAEVITERQTTLGFDKQAWMLLFSRIAQMPEQSWLYAHSLYNNIMDALIVLPVYKAVLLILAILSWVVIWLIGRYYTSLVVEKVESKRIRLSDNLLYTVIILLRRNLFGLILFGSVLTLLIVSKVSFAAYAAIFYLILVWFVTRFLIGIVRLLLVERISDSSGRDVQLYHRLKWSLIFGGIISGLMIYANFLNVAVDVLNLLSRLFMLFLLVISLVLFNGRKVILELINFWLSRKRGYIRRAVRWIITLLPIVIFIDAVVGLLGYINLAWVMSYYQLVFVIVATGYLILRGVVSDLVDVASEFAIRRLSNGWLLSEALFKPIDRIARLIMLVVATVILFVLYGWTTEPLIIDTIGEALQFDIVSFAGTTITLLSVVEFIVLVFIFVWAAKWIKEFSYRFFFKNIRDVGARYSLSVFSQYIMVTLGTIITLRVLGIDFSGMAFVLGGLMVGLGFGLRDFANNIFSGFMLLIERPVREGDIISVGDFEGEVTHIGLRSITVRSWDNREILVPNSEVYNKTFTNWTHVDDIVRVESVVKIHRQDNPYRAEQLILNVLTAMPEVLEHPEPHVLIKELADGIIEFEARLYIDVRKHSRFKVRSQALFSIWKSFVEEGIKAAYPRQEIQFIKPGE
jgi:potassium-dependent mechanosensitive channel